MSWSPPLRARDKDNDKDFRLGNQSQSGHIISSNTPIPASRECSALRKPADKNGYIKTRSHPAGRITLLVDDGRGEPVKRSSSSATASGIEDPLRDPLAIGAAHFLQVVRQRGIKAQQLAFIHGQDRAQLQHLIL